MSAQRKILELTKKHPKLTSGAIALRLKCHPAYVRAVWHRHGIFKRKHDTKVIYDWSKYVRLTHEEYDELLKKAGMTRAEHVGAI